MERTEMGERKEQDICFFFFSSCLKTLTSLDNNKRIGMEAFEIHVPTGSHVKFESKTLLEVISSVSAKETQTSSREQRTKIGVKRSQHCPHSVKFKKKFNYIQSKQFGTSQEVICIVIQIIS